MSETNLHVWLSFGAKFQNELTAAVHFILKMHLATWQLHGPVRCGTPLQ